MARRQTLGFVENEWTCPNCSTRNKGSVKTCENCGAPQPENVKFELPSEQKFVKDEAAVNAAKAGADIHCGFCGTRNPATAETCSQCGADLKEGKAREAGQGMQAPPPQSKVIKCNNCGTENPGNRSNCSNCGAALPKAQAAQTAAPKPAMATAQPVAKKKTNRLLIGGILGALALCCVVAVVIFFLPAKTVEATVTGVHWETSVPLQELQVVRYTDEKGSPPSDAYDVSCKETSQEVCATEVIDKGNGYSEVVQNCETQTEQYCSYTIDEWKTIQTFTNQGDNLQPVYASPNYSGDQKLGDPSEKLTVTFSTQDGPVTYSPNSIDAFQQFTIDSTWTLTLNRVGGVVKVEP